MTYQPCKFWKSWKLYWRARHSEACLSDTTLIMLETFRYTGMRCPWFWCLVSENITLILNLLK